MTKISFVLFVLAAATIGCVHGGLWSSETTTDNVHEQIERYAMFRVAVSKTVNWADVSLDTREMVTKIYFLRPFNDVQSAHTVFNTANTFILVRKSDSVLSWIPIS
jgi:hypothetical protein